MTRSIAVELKPGQTLLVGTDDTGWDEFSLSRDGKTIRRAGKVSALAWKLYSPPVTDGEYAAFVGFTNGWKHYTQHMTSGEPDNHA